MIKKNLFIPQMNVFYKNVYAYILFIYTYCGDFCRIKVSGIKTKERANHSFTKLLLNYVSTNEKHKICKHNLSTNKPNNKETIKEQQQ